MNSMNSKAGEVSLTIFDTSHLNSRCDVCDVCGCAVCGVECELSYCY